MAERRPQSKVTKGVEELFAGGVAGCAAKCCMAPIDRVKILFQVHHHHYRHLGIVPTLKTIYKTEGFYGLFKGNGAQQIRVFPYGGINFYVHDLCKEYLRENTSNTHIHLQRFVSGAIAGVAATIVTYPFDMARAGLAFQAQGEHVYGGIWHLLKSIYFESGIRGLWSGVGISLLGMVPYAGFTFYTYETAKAYCLEEYPNQFGSPSVDASHGLVLKDGARLLIGGAAGLIGQTMSYPIDVVRRRLQLSVMHREHHPNRKALDIFWHIYRDQGPRGFVRGLSINYIRAVPTSAIAFTVFEEIKQRCFHLDTGADR